MGNMDSVFQMPDSAKPSYLNVEDVIKYDTDLFKSVSQVDEKDKEKTQKLNEKINDLSELVKNKNGDLKNSVFNTQDNRQHKSGTKLGRVPCFIR